MFKRRKTALVVLALAAAAVFVLPASSASAGSATTPNACANSVTANFSQIGVTTNGDDGLTTVPAGGATTTTGLSQQGAVPGAIFVAGYNLGLLVVGPNTIPATVNTKIEGTNTTQGTQTSSNAATSVQTTISDPDGTPGTGDETGTDATFNASYADMSWTAGASGTIDYRQDSIAAWPATDANNTLRIAAVVGGFLNVTFRCAPGTVTPPDPGTVALIDPAGSFDTTLIESPSTISIGDAEALEGAAETFTVSLSAPQSGTVTVDYATADGSATAGSDYTAASGTVTFAPGDVSETVTVNTIDDTLVEGDETFDVNLSNPVGSATILDGTGVGTIHDNDVENVAPTANAGADQTVECNTLVQLDGTLSSDSDGTIVSYAWTAPAGITLSDPSSATPTFDSGAGPASLTFTLTVTDDDGATGTDSVVVTVNACPMIDATGLVIVNGPVSSTKTSKSFVYKVTNVGTTPITINESNITGSVTVNGTLTGSVAVNTFTKTLNPGASTRVKLVWSYPAGSLVAGDVVVFSSCVTVSGDIDTTNDCDDQSVTVAR